VKVGVIRLIALLLLLPASGSHANSATALTQVILVSDPGDPVGQGRTFSFQEKDGVWNGYGRDYSQDRLVDTVDVNFSGSNGTGWTFQFSTMYMDASLLPGFYDKVRLAPVGAQGYPMMSVSSNAACDELIGNFTIIDAQFESSGSERRILSLAVEFEQHCRAYTPALRGILLYNYTLPATPMILTRSPVERAPVGRPYSLSFSALAGTPPYSWSAGDGRTIGITRFEAPHLPPGLSLDSGGLLSGTPSTPGCFNFNVTVTDAAGEKSEKEIRIETEVRESAPPVSEFYFESDRADWVGQGATLSIHDEIYPAFIGPQKAYFVIHSGGSWAVTFSTETMLQNLVPGFYGSAERSGYSDWASPGMDIYGNGRGCNTVTGFFTILDYQVDYSGAVPRAKSFAATFEQHCEGSSVSLRGHFYYNYEVPLRTSIVTYPVLPEAGASQSYDQTLVATGGIGPYTWALTGGQLPGGLTLSPDGKFGGVPTEGGDFTFRLSATDAQGVVSEREFSIHIIQPLVVATPSTLPQATLRQPYSFALTASGGTPPYSWSITNGVAGRQPPPGMTLSSTGVLSGIPIVSSTYYMDIHVTDANSRPADAEIKLDVLTPDGLLGQRQLILISDPGDYVGMGYDYLMGDQDGNWNAYGTIRAGGSLVDDVRVTFSGQGGDFWSVRFATAKLGVPLGPGFYTDVQLIPIESDSHPGMTISGEGRGCNYVHGSFRILDSEMDYSLETPRVVRFAATFEQYCENSTAAIRGAILYGYSPDWPVRIVSLSPLPDAALGLPYAQTLLADGGQPPYSWGLSRGELPQGLVLGQDGTLSGTPTAAGIYSFTIRVTDATGVESEREITIEVTAALTVTSLPMPKATRGLPYREALTASGGTPPYTWALADGLYGRQPPVGLTMDSTGVISGTPIVSATQYFPVRVTDARSRKVTADLALEVYNPDGTLGQKELNLISEPGDSIGLGQNYSYDDRQGNWVTTATDSSLDGLVDQIEINLWPAGTSTDRWTVSFSTAKTGIPLSPGTYTDALGVPVLKAGHPGLSIYGQGRGCSSSVKGSFTILEAVFDYSQATPRVVSFAATFEQFCDSNTAPLRGEIRYGAVK